MQRSDKNKENKKVAIFFLFVLAVFGGALGWLMLVEPEVVPQDVVKEIPYAPKAS